MTHPSSPRAPAITRLVWSIALPAILTNVATALFGLADMWAIGRLGDAPAQGAVELGAKFMMGLLTVFNFLRTGTVALTAQAAGRGDARAQAEALARSLAVAFAIALVLLAAMPLTIGAGLDLLGARGAVREAARSYVAIRYWGGPLWLANCVLTGWLIGQRQVRAVLAVEIAANALHVALDLALVLGFGWGVAGVAGATVTSEGFKTGLLALFVIRRPQARAAASALRDRATWADPALRGLFALNRDLFVRTLLLTGAMLLFARSGAQQGPAILAANAILFQLFMLATLVLDGFESASQVLCGEALGAGQRQRFAALVRATLGWAGLVALAIAAAYAVLGSRLAASFSTDPEVARLAARYARWTVLLPLAGFASFVLDGVFVGAGWTRAMLATMLAAIGVYVALLWMDTRLGNDGLWLAFMLFFVTRAAGQIAVLPRLVARSFGAA